MAVGERHESSVGAADVLRWLFEFADGEPKSCRRSFVSGIVSLSRSFSRECSASSSSDAIQGRRLSRCASSRAGLCDDEERGGDGSEEHHRDHHHDHHQHNCHRPLHAPVAQRFDPETRAALCFDCDRAIESGRNVFFFRDRRFCSSRCRANWFDRHARLAHARKAL